MKAEIGFEKEKNLHKKQHVGIETHDQWQHQDIDDPCGLDYTLAEHIFSSEVQVCDESKGGAMGSKHSQKRIVLYIWDAD